MRKAINKFLGERLPFKSQKNQDKWVIFEIMPYKFGGFFLDLAAADGVLHSNTYVLEKIFRWKGICIEPNPVFFEQLTKTRNNILINKVISDSAEEVDFRIDNGQLGGIVSDFTDNNFRTRKEQLSNASIIKLPTISLMDVLEQNNAPRNIDYFSLDIEGSEEMVIRSIDFDKYSFNCITIERPTPQVNKILFENGYLFVKNYYFDTFYVHKKYLGKVKCDMFEQIPPKNW